MARAICSVEVLRNTALFSRVHERHIESIVPHVRQHRYAARSLVIRAGEPVAGVYIVISGTLTVSQETEDGSRFIAALLGRGDVFGELALVGGAISSSTLEAQSDCELLFVPRRNLTRLLVEQPEVAFSVLNVALARLADAHSALGRLGLMSVSDRVAHVLLHAMRRVNGEARVELACSRIAEMVGASREMISRVIARMSRAGVVRREGTALVVVDQAALALRSSCKSEVTRRMREGRARTHRVEAPAAIA